ncbi:MAG: LamG domain-containing protein [Gammaproteobacteria bacterium]|nr:LamG domain-containing protein [Gammaproteobacteria bacterium]
MSSQLNLALLFLCLCVLLSNSVIAGNVPANDIKSFVAGDVAKAQDVNDNFNNLREAINDNDLRIDNAVLGSNAPVVMYDFEEVSGNTSADGSGNNNILSVPALGVTRSDLGHSGNGIILDGSSGFVSAASSATLNPNLEMTVSAWVFQTGNQAQNNCIVCKEGQYLLAVNNGQLQAAFKTANGPDMAYVGAGSIPQDEWTHISASYDGLSIRTFVNGQMTSLVSYAHGVLAETNNELRIGGRSGDTPEFYAGRIDEVRIYGYARNPQLSMASLVSVVTNMDDYRLIPDTSTVASHIQAAEQTWTDIPERVVNFTKYFENSRLKIIYQDTLGSHSRFYQACEWRILLDGNVVSHFSTADDDHTHGTTTIQNSSAWTMDNGAHMAWAVAPVGQHTVTVQARHNRGVWGTEVNNTTQCLQGWNTVGNFLSVEEIP